MDAPTVTIAVAAAVSAGATVALVLVTRRYVTLTSELVGLGIVDRRRAQPHVALELHERRSGDHVASITNVGGGPALNLHLVLTFAPIEEGDYRGTYDERTVERSVLLPGERLWIDGPISPSAAVSGAPSRYPRVTLSGTFDDHLGETLHAADEIDLVARARSDRNARIFPADPLDDFTQQWGASFTRDGNRPRILLTNHGPTDARTTVVELIRHRAHPPRVRGLVGSAGGDNLDRVELGDVAMGDSRELVIGEDQQDNAGGEVRLRVHSQAPDGRASTTSVAVEVPGIPQAF